MLNLDSTLILNRGTILSPNLCDRFSSDDLKKIGEHCKSGYLRDLRSREVWEKRNRAAMDLAMQVVRDKNFPWPNASNVAFPLVTIAALQFHARAYPTVVQGPNVVRCRVIGPDPTGAKRERADRISTYMSYQLLEEDRAWEEQHDRLLINLPIVGTAFKKTYYDSSLGHVVSETVLAQHLVLDYYAKSVESCLRKTHRIPLYRNEVYERIMRDTFRDVRDELWFRSPPLPPTGEQEAHTDNRRGMTRPEVSDDSTPIWFLEQHTSLDLDGDGYAEPYIITLEERTGSVVRIVTRFDREEDIERTVGKKIIRIHPMEYFTKYPFIPSPDGGIYDVGFGSLLGPLNESVNTLINQLIDAGTLANSAGGFLGRGAKIRGGVYTVSPFTWMRVDSSTDDLRKSIFPLPVRDPSAVLFNLLVLLVNYTNRIAGTTDLLVGENIGQNTTAEVGRTMLEQGMKIFSAIFKRIWRAEKEEFKKLYKLNSIYLPIKGTFSGGSLVRREDFLGDPEEVVPVADPNLASEEQQFQQAVALKQAAATTPGYNVAAVEKRFLRSMKVDGIDELYPGPDAVPPSKHPKVQIEEMRLHVKMLELRQRAAEFAAELMEEHRMNTAQIIKIQGELELKQQELSGDIRDREINALNTMLGILKQRDESILKRLELFLKASELSEVSRNEQQGSGQPGRRLEQLVEPPRGEAPQEPSPPVEGGSEGAVGSRPLY